MRLNRNSSYFRISYRDQVTGKVITFDNHSVVEVKKALKALIQTEQTSLGSIRALHGKEEMGFDAVHAWIIQDTNALLTKRYKLDREGIEKIIQQIDGY